jgi:hypothetical protein
MNQNVMIKKTLDLKQDPYKTQENMNPAQNKSILINSSREILPRDYLLPDNQNRGKSAQIARDITIEHLPEHCFKYGGPTSRSNSRSHLKTYKPIDEPKLRSISQTSNPYKLNKMELHIKKQFSDKQLIVGKNEIKYNPY